MGNLLQNYNGCSKGKTLVSYSLVSKFLVCTLPICGGSVCVCVGVKGCNRNVRGQGWAEPCVLSPDLRLNNVRDSYKHP